MRASTTPLGRGPRSWRISVGTDPATGEDITLVVVLCRDGRVDRGLRTPPRCPICGYDADEDRDRCSGRSFDPPHGSAETGPLATSWSRSDLTRSEERIAPSGCGKAHQLMEGLKALDLSGSGSVRYHDTCGDVGEALRAALVSSLFSRRAGEPDTPSTAETPADEATGEGGTP